MLSYMSRRREAFCHYQQKHNMCVGLICGFSDDENFRQSATIFLAQCVEAV